MPEDDMAIFRPFSGAPLKSKECNDEGDPEDLPENPCVCLSFLEHSAKNALRILMKSSVKIGPNSIVQPATTVCQKIFVLEIFEVQFLKILNDPKKS
jgi:hypothetical protein